MHILLSLNTSGSKLDHDCKPNAVATFHGNTLVVKATENIEGSIPDKVRK